MLVYDSGIAQLVEHLTVNQGVVSSSLTTGVVGDITCRWYLFSFQKGIGNGITNCPGPPLGP